MPDPSIPRHPRGRPVRMTQGRFVRYDADTVLLTDRYGNTYNQEWVSIVQGGFGNRNEGCRKPPRPWEYDAAGNPTVEGDVVLILFLDDSNRRPVVIPGVRTIQADDWGFLDYNFNQDPVDALKARFVYRDAAGAEAGVVHVTVNQSAGAVTVGGGFTGIYSGGPREGPPAAKLEVSGDGRITMQTESGGALVKVETTTEGAEISVGDNALKIMATEDKVVINHAGGTAQPIIVGESFLNELIGVLSEVQAALNGLGFPMANLASFLLNAAIEKAAPTGWLLSERTESE